MSATGATTRVVHRFAAGAIAVLTVHQGAVWLLHRGGVTPWPAWALDPTAPFGVPRVLSAAAWGGAWWVVLSPMVERATGARHWTRAALLGAVPPTAVGALLTVVGGAFPRGRTSPVVLLVAALGVNALWGLGAAALRRRGARRAQGAPTTR
jgi:hypothetical protein